MLCTRVPLQFGQWDSGPIGVCHVQAQPSCALHSGALSDHPQVTVSGARNKHVLSYVSEIVGKLVTASDHPKPPSLLAVCVRADIDLEVASLQGLQMYRTSEEQRTHSLQTTAMLQTRKQESLPPSDSELCPLVSGMWSVQLCPLDAGHLA